MIRLNLVVEGQTEETFVRDILATHLSKQGVFPYSRSVETGRKSQRIYRGGLINYDKAKKDIQLWIKQDKRPEAYFTVMFDLYRLPPSFPGYAIAKEKADLYKRVVFLEEELRKDIGHPYDKFIPYIQLYEFEAILFSDPKKIGYNFPDSASQITKLVEIRANFNSPEQINDENPPSKRILSLFPNYQKVDSGSIIALDIGLETIRKECPHFNEWITKLEALSEHT